MYVDHYKIRGENFECGVAVMSGKVVEASLAASYTLGWTLEELKDFVLRNGYKTLWLDQESGKWIEKAL